VAAVAHPIQLLIQVEAKAKILFFLQLLLKAGVMVVRMFKAMAVTAVLAVVLEVTIPAIQFKLVV
jgi:hypothetical protein